MEARWNVRTVKLPAAALRVLLSALACEPGRGTEPEVGYRTMLAVASQNEVWVLTLADKLPLLKRALERSPFAGRIHLYGVDFGISSEAFDRQTRFEYHRHYDPSPTTPRSPLLRLRPSTRSPSPPCSAQERASVHTRAELWC
jgi:hypothetical protein